MLKATPGQYAQLAPLVFQCAEQGDAQALQLISQAAAFIEKVSQRFLDAGISHITMVGGIAPRLLPYLPRALQQKIQYQQAAPGLGALSFAKTQWHQEKQDSIR
jgi:glucosamine kinase